jgi:hypothetical protein
LIYITRADIGYPAPQILRHLTARELFAAQRVSRHFQHSIASSRVLQRAMFLCPSPTGTIAPHRTTRFVRGFPRHDTVWATSKGGGGGAVWSSELNDMVWPRLNPEINYYVVNRKLDTQKMRDAPPDSSSRLALRLVPRSCMLGTRADDSRRRMLVTQPPVVDVVVGRSDAAWGMHEVHNEKGVTVGDVLEVEERAARKGGPPPVVRRG